MRTCKACKTKFEPQYNTIQPTCSIKCAIDYANDKNLKERRKDTRKRKQALKTRSDWLREAEMACNAYIVYRDRNDPCISCGTMKPDIQYAAGHYKTKGAHPELRFHPMNIHKQCNKNCNLHLSGNISNYRPKLIEKIGISQVEWLEGPQQPQNWTIEDAKEIKQYYKEQLKYLKSV